MSQVTPLTSLKEPHMLSTQVSGLPAHKDTPIIFFMPGFPDDHGSWIKLAPRFADTHTVVTFCMPDFDEPAPTRYFGYSFTMIIAMLDASIKKQAALGQHITLVAHDWGCLVAFMYLAKCKENVDKFVALDIGVPGHGKTSMKSNVVNLCYQSWLAAAYLLGRLTFTLFGDFMFAVFPWNLVGPCPYESETPPRTSGYQPCSFMAYPYFRVFKALFGFDSKDLALITSMSTPNIPILFVYGKKKRAEFHTPEFLEYLEKTDGCAWEALDCGHFLQVQKPYELEKAMKKFLGVEITPREEHASTE